MNFLNDFQVFQWAPMRSEVWLQKPQLPSSAIQEVILVDPLKLWLVGDASHGNFSRILWKIHPELWMITAMDQGLRAIKE